MGDLSAVIAGLDPAIHHIETTLVFLMDARVKPAHDESKSETVGIIGSGLGSVTMRRPDLFSS